jgi:hypothetical protein
MSGGSQVQSLVWPSFLFNNNYKTPFERLHHTKPDVAHLRVFRCEAYVFLPEDVRSNNLSPRSELMTFIGLIEGTKGYIFMRSPNNNVFTAIQALFDKTLFSKCPNMCHVGYTPVGLPPDDLQGGHNRPLDDENGDYGVDFLLSQWDQQVVRYHGSLQHSHHNHHMLIHLYHHHSLPPGVLTVA